MYLNVQVSAGEGSELLSSFKATTFEDNDEDDFWENLVPKKERKVPRESPTCVGVCGYISLVPQEAQLSSVVVTGKRTRTAVSYADIEKGVPLRDIKKVPVCGQCVKRRKR